jgi:hypothetical protein
MSDFLNDLNKGSVIFDEDGNKYEIRNNYTLLYIIDLENNYINNVIDTDKIIGDELETNIEHFKKHIITMKLKEIEIFSYKTEFKGYNR